MRISLFLRMEDAAAASLGNDRHHVVWTQNLNPVAVRVLDEGQATYFTCGGRTQGQKTAKVYFNIDRNTISNHLMGLNLPHETINQAKGENGSRQPLQHKQCCSLCFYKLSWPGCSFCLFKPQKTPTGRVTVWLTQQIIWELDPPDWPGTRVNKLWAGQLKFNKGKLFHEISSSVHSQ